MLFWLKLNFSPTLVVLVLLSMCLGGFQYHTTRFEVHDLAGYCTLLFACWVCSALVRADFYASRIDGALEFYQARLSLRGVKLEQSPGESDDAPCERHYRFLAPTVRIELGAIRSWRLIRAIYHQKVSLSELESYSKWESTKLPTL